MFWATVPRPLAEVLPQLDPAAMALGWSVSPSSTLYRRFYTKGMSASTYGAHAVVDVWQEADRTRMRLSVTESAVIDWGRPKGRTIKFVTALGGTLDGG